MYVVVFSLYIMKMDDKSQFSNCSSFEIEQLTSINLARSLSGGLCCFLSFTITLLLFISKSYQSVLQRLLLYMMLATTFSELFLTASFEHHFKFSDQSLQDKVCTWISYLYNWANILRTVFTIGVMIYLFFLVRYLARGNTVPQFLQLKPRRALLEIMYVVLSPMLTFAYASVPMFTHDYGLAGAWCWIRVLDDDCEMLLSGLLSQLFFGYIIFVLNGIIGIAITIALAVMYCQLPATLQESQLLLKKTLLIMVCFFVYVTVQVASFSNRMITANANVYRNFSTWIILGIAYPASLLVFPVAFILSFYQVTKLFKKFFCCLCWKNADKSRRHVHFQQNTHNAPTFQDSTRVSLPSDTYFRIPYTNEFTHIITENQSLVHSADKGDTSGKVSGSKYGTVVCQQESEMS